MVMRQLVNNSPIETMLTIRQVADFLHVSMSTVRRWSASGILKSYRVGPRGDRRYQRDDVLRFLEESTRHERRE
jgi:excisionase family DNA binding protein